MNLFEVDKSIWSHPNKPYVSHIENIANSFDDKAHKISANFHDIGKLSDEFQRYIRKETDQKTTHAIEGGYLFYFLTESIDENFLSIFFSIVKHHLSLPDIKNDVYKYSNNNENIFERESWIKKIEVIKKNLKNKKNHSAEEFHDLLRMFVDNFESFSTIDNFFLFKKRYSRLILADKFEAIFSQSYKNIPILSNKSINKHLIKIENLISEKQKERPNKYRTNARETIFNNFDMHKNSNVYLIKAPTGIGKTFIALELSLKIAKDRGDKRRIITAIPFTSIIDQTHLEYEKILGTNSVLKYHHLTKQKEKQEADEKEQFSQKVFLTDIWHESFIVTTFNQLLYTLFSNHNRDNVRLETLRDSVIIIDEVQNIPRILLKSVSFAINEFAKRYNIDFIIMSATMPNIYDEFENVQLISDDCFYTDKNNRYVLLYDENLGEYDTLKNVICKEKGSVLCVVNTIEKAKTLHKLINQPNCFLLTTHQTPHHRKVIIRLIKCKLKHNIKITLISTQLIEAGVDLDFDVGFREFAPFASIIQMAGRVNREGKHSKPCKVIIFDYIEGKDAPYHKTDLQEDEIKKVLKIPLQEIELLSNMDKYFVDIKYQTNHIDLQKFMKNLEFQTLFKALNDNFMPHQPWKVSLFIEQKKGHFDEYIEKRERIFQWCGDKEDKFDALNHVKNLEKDLGNHTISINHKLIEELKARKHTIKELFGRFILPQESKYYTKERGFDLDLTILEEAFSE